MISNEANQTNKNRCNCMPNCNNIKYNFKVIHKLDLSSRVNIISNFNFEITKFDFILSVWFG